MKYNNTNSRKTSMRLQSWDYGTNAAYFITICTHNKQHFWGNIVDGAMQLNEIGKLAEKYGFQIPQHFPYTELANFVVMPNHIHGILIINKSADVLDPPVDLQFISNSHPTTTSPTAGGCTGIHNQMLHENVSRIIRWYKGRCSYEMRKINPDFAWQSLFYDHIIRNAKAFDKIQTYIANNPITWEQKFGIKRKSSI